MTRVVLLEADYWHRRGVATALSDAAEIEIVQEDAPEAEVVLLSLARIQERGLAEIERVGRRYSAAVLVYGEDHDDATAADLFVAGAAGYHASTRDRPITEAISHVANGGVWGPRSALPVLAERLRQMNPAEIDPDAAVLELLNEGLTNKEIAQRLGLAESTIKTKMNRLCRRFGVSTRLQLLTAAIRRGVVRIRSEAGSQGEDESRNAR